MTDTAIEQRDEAIAEALAAGRSVRAVRREFSLTIAELDAALERFWPLDTAARLRTIRGDLGWLDRLIEVFFTKALAGDVHSGVLTVKARERKAELLGLDAVQRIDLQITQTEQRPTQHEQIRRAIFALARGNPDYRPGDGGNGSQTAVDALADSGDDKPSDSWSAMIGLDRPRFGLLDRARAPTRGSIAGRSESAGGARERKSIQRAVCWCCWLRVFVKRETRRDGALLELHNLPQTLELDPA